jgi:hypothetical protein
VPGSVILYAHLDLSLSMLFKHMIAKVPNSNQITVRPTITINKACINQNLINIIPRNIIYVVHV